jgi:hypothetical protein
MGPPMNSVWRIEGWDGQTQILERDLPGYFAEDEISVLLQRLVCTNLSPTDVVRASLRKNMPGYLRHFERVGTGNLFVFGDGPHYTAATISSLSR